MEKRLKKSRRKNMIGLIITFLLLAAIFTFLAVEGILCKVATDKAILRLETYNAKTEMLSYGKITYVDKGEGNVIFSVHGIFGGYDQAFDTCNEFSDNCRVIAPSRFGYLGSDVLGGGTPAEQATAYVELLDKLGIDKVYLIATSAGGTVAIRFAFDYPERTSGIILYCSAAPLTEKPEKYIKYAGPPSFLCNNYMMFMISPLFPSVMGMKSKTIYSMMPIDYRKQGIAIDAIITNPDMAKNYEQYPIESLQSKTLILHAKDDKIASYADMEKAVSRFTNCTFLSFETGGHLMAGNGVAINKAVLNFMKN